MRDPLTDFLLARITEDEEGWTRMLDDMEYQVVADRILVECEAKRRAIEEAFIVQAGSTEVVYIGDNVRKRAIYPSALAMLKATASVYADHPDYRSKWKPS